MTGDNKGDSFLNEVLGRRIPQQTFNGPQEAVVTKADALQCWFSLSIDPNVQYGPAPYPRPAVLITHLSDTHGDTAIPDPHGHAPAIPPVGTVCLVVFVGTRQSKPWVICFSGWPIPGEPGWPGPVDD